MLQLNVATYDWLTYLELIPKSLQKEKQGYKSVSNEITQKIQNGYLVGKLLDTLSILDDSAQDKQTLQQYLVDDISQQKMNWKKLFQILPKYNVYLDSNIQKGLQIGDHEHLNVFLNILFRLACQKLENCKKEKEVLKQSKNQIPAPLIQNKKTEPKIQKILEPIQKEIKKHIVPGSGSRPFAQFMINCLQMNLNITDKEAIKIMKQDNLILSELIIKGVQQDYEQILQFFFYLYQNQDLIVKYISHDLQEMKIFLQINKLGILSMDQEVSGYLCQFNSLLLLRSKHYSSYNILAQNIISQQYNLNLITQSQILNHFSNFFDIILKFYLVFIMIIFIIIFQIMNLFLKYLKFELMY